MAEDDLTAADALDERERDMLDFEREWWKYAGAKEQAIKARFDLSTTRYYELLNRLIDRDDAVGYDPMLVKRLRRLRAQRQRQRAARRASNY
jgi:ribosomal protein S12 methylthiotransferase accessory factor YcaO